MSKLELTIRRWVFRLGQRLIHGSNRPGREGLKCQRVRVGHWLCGLASGIKPCCIRYFLSDKCEQDRANAIAHGKPTEDLMALSSKLYGPRNGPEFGYAPCSEHRHANLYPIQVNLGRSQDLERVLAAWQREFLERVFKQS
jgi:hypothetical protein